jgi:hypothetical protein
VKSSLRHQTYSFFPAYILPKGLFLLEYFRKICNSKNIRAVIAVISLFFSGFVRMLIRPECFAGFCHNDLIFGPVPDISRMCHANYHAEYFSTFVIHACPIDNFARAFPDGLI